jgi:hypothetical protein
MRCAFSPYGRNPIIIKAFEKSAQDRVHARDINAKA